MEKRNEALPDEGLEQLSNSLSDNQRLWKKEFNIYIYLKDMA